MQDLHALFIEQLQDMYSAEQQLVQALPELASAASSSMLRNTLQSHLDETHRHVEYVQQLLEKLGTHPGEKTCKAMEGLVKEAREIANKDGDADARDAGIISAAQKAEHYEIATYGSLRTWARVLDNEEAATVLQTVLDQEYAADNRLDRLAESYINQQARD